MKDMLQLHQALSDETRVRLLMVLRVRGFCVCELTELLHIPQTNISKHLSKLRDWGLVETSRRERFIEYSLNQTSLYMQEALVLLEGQLHDYPLLLQDNIRANNHFCVSCNPTLVKA